MRLLSEVKVPSKTILTDLFSHTSSFAQYLICQAVFIFEEHLSKSKGEDDLKGGEQAQMDLSIQMIKLVFGFLLRKEDKVSIIESAGLKLKAMSLAERMVVF